MNRLCILILGCTLLGGCGGKGGKVLGKLSGGQVHNIIAVRAGEVPKQVTLQGVMVEKCPVAGCWFYLQDTTGIIKVDTKAAGFVVVDVPVQTKMTVSGTVVTEGDDVFIQGSGLRF